MSMYPEFDVTQIHPEPFSAQRRKVGVGQLSGCPSSGASFSAFLHSLPRIGGGQDLRRVAGAIAAARRRERAVVVACGGHVVKCGMAPMLIALMQRRLITALAVNGAVAIHDAEIALFGTTSEYVEQGLQSGSFGMASETATFVNTALAQAKSEGLGAGESVGRSLLHCDAPFADQSLLATAYQLRIPVTVHLAIGTDIVHMHPSADGAAMGEASLRDFRILTEAMRSLSGGGVLLNIGSAVILPETLLKAMAILRNVDPAFAGFLGVNMDFQQQYRSNTQIVARMETLDGEGIALTGQHEFLIPLLAFATLEAWESGQDL